jgi:hypothetical protein
MFKFFLLASIGSLGGFAVLRGLWLEYSGEKERYSDIGDFRKSKLRARRGLKRVFWGVAIETVLGFGIAIFEGAETIKTAIAAIANNPLNQPINSMKADIFLWINATNSFEALLRAKDPWVTKAASEVLILPKGFVLRKDTALGSLRCVEYDVRPAPESAGGGTVCAMSFSWPSGNLDDNSPQGSPIATRSVSIEELDEKMGSLELFMVGLETNSEIRIGACNLTLNGSIKRQFSVPKRIQRPWIDFPIATNTIDRQ